MKEKNQTEFKLHSLQLLVKPEYQQLIDELQQIEPHDLVRHDTWFSDETKSSIKSSILFSHLLHPNNLQIYLVGKPPQFLQFEHQSDLLQIA